MRTRIAKGYLAQIEQLRLIQRLLCYRHRPLDGRGRPSYRSLALLQPVPLNVPFETRRDAGSTFLVDRLAYCDPSHRIVKTIPLLSAWTTIDAHSESRHSRTNVQPQAIPINAGMAYAG
jgi:hypothetical protein